MFESIYVATSGMLGAERALNVISNNVANLNTPGFRGSTINFANLFSGSLQDTTQNNEFAGQQFLGGGGVDASQAELDMTPGTQQQTGNALDLFLQGNGFFVVQNAGGVTQYTRDGSFHFDAAGDLVTADESVKVMSQDASGQLVPINLSTLQLSAPKTTTEVDFTGDLSPDDAEHTISSLVVFDKTGASHTLQVVFTKNTASAPPGGTPTPAGSTTTTTAGGAPSAPTPGGTAAATDQSGTSWSVTVSENGTQVGSGTVAFDSTGELSPGSASIAMTLDLNGTDPADVSFNFNGVQGFSIAPAAGASTGTTTAPSSDNSTLAVEKQDGAGPGKLTSETFDQNGVLQLVYSNGQTTAGPALAFAEIPNSAALVEQANSLFSYQGTTSVTLRKAGGDLQVVSQALESSNVDLTAEFSKLILMQRGYQGASQVVSTANDMLQQLLDMRSNR